MRPRPLHFLLLVFAGWVNRRQVAVIEYLKEENRILREQLQGRQRRLLTCSGDAWRYEATRSGGAPCSRSRA
jgi:hypothetical protein